MRKRHRKRGVINIYTHYFSVTKFDGLVRQMMHTLVASRLKTEKFIKVKGRWQRILDKLYIWTAKDGSEVRYHINMLDDFWMQMGSGGVGESQFIVTDNRKSLYTPADADIKVKESFQLYDYQEDILRHVVADGHRKIIALPTGKGKTVTVLKCAEFMKVRTAIVVLPKYKDRWKQDIVNYCEDFDKDDLLVIDSTDKLVKVLADFDRGKFRKYRSTQFVLFTLTTMKLYQKLYHQSPKKLIAPERIWELMQIGFRFTDESHEHFHANFSLDLFTHMPKTSYLSATLDPTEQVMIGLYQVMYPSKERMGEDQYTPYIDVQAFIYRHEEPKSWRHMVQEKYNHAVYEDNFMKNGNEAAKAQYFEMITDLLEKNYFSIRQPGQKAIVFFSRIDMCTAYSEYLKERYPDTDIRRYVGEDDYEDIISAEIAVSTHGSAGTAIDIPGLILNILTISMLSRQANLQNMGRLRELKKWPGQRPRFIYLASSDIDAQFRYHQAKQELLANRAYSIIEHISPVILRKEF